MNNVSIGISYVCDDDDAFVLAKTTSFSLLCYVHVGETLSLFNVIEWLSNM